MGGGSETRSPSRATSARRESKSKPPSVLSPQTAARFDIAQRSLGGEQHEEDLASLRRQRADGMTEPDHRIASSGGAGQDCQPQGERIAARSADRLILQ